MRFSLLMLCASLSFGAHAAESSAKDQPSAPAKVASDAADDQDVVITKQTDQTIEEYRINGKLYMIKITPKYGPPYYLVDDRGDGKFARQDSLDTGFRVPRWIIKQF